MRLHRHVEIKWKDCFVFHLTHPTRVAEAGDGAAPAHAAPTPPAVALAPVDTGAAGGSTS